MTWVDQILGANVDYVAMAVPLFFTLIFIEFACAAIARLDVYRLNDSINDLSCGIIDQTLKIFLHGVFLALYFLVYEHFRIWDVANWSPAGKTAAALALFFGVDFCFYWHHRWAHEFAVPWATHVVHHQSEEFNLIVALRQSALEHYMMFFCYLPLAVIGFPPAWYVAMFAFNLIWQFFCHTRLIRTLGPIEWVMNTPSHHRVHHGRNLKYLDKNYAGTLIIWDRLFGTFQREEEEPVYGITRPIESWNPIWANLHYWVELWHIARAAPRWRDKVLLWFMPLGWTPPGVAPKPPLVDVSRAEQRKYDSRPTLPVQIYAAVHFLVVLWVGLGLEQGAGHSLMAMAPAALWVLYSLLVLGGMLDRRRWSFWAEFPRLGMLLIGVLSPLAAAWGWWERGSFALAILLSMAWISRRGNDFYPQCSFTQNLDAQPVGG